MLNMAKEIVRLHEENERLKRQYGKNKRSKKVDPNYEKNERARKWTEGQYRKAWNTELEEQRERLTQIKVHRPQFIPINDCMDFYGQESNTNK